MASRTKNETIQQVTTDKQIQLYTTVYPLLKSAYEEVKEFSKKKQDDALNLSKVKLINRLLENSRIILEQESTVEYLDLLDEDQLPSNSDAVLLMSLYISALHKFYSDHYVNDSSLGFGWDNEGHRK